MALAFTPLFIMPTVLFSGLMINNEAQFDWLAWIQYVSPLKYTIEAMVKIEFLYDKFGVGEQLNKTIDYNLDLSTCFLALIGMLLFMRTISYFFFIKMVAKYK